MKQMPLDSSIGKYYDKNGVISHLQKIAEKFSAIGDHWIPTCLINGRFLSLPYDGTFKNVPLFIEINKYGSQLGYHPKEGFVTHMGAFNAQMALIPVGYVTVTCKTSHYIDDEGWENTWYDIKLYDWKQS